MNDENECSDWFKSSGNIFKLINKYQKIRATKQLHGEVLNVFWIKNTKVLTN